MIRLMNKITHRIFSKKTKITWVSDDIPEKPWMDDESLPLFINQISSAKKYLEYGSGGSTVLAADIGVKEIHSVDSDLGFMNAVKQKVKSRHPNVSLHMHHVDIGPTGDWGIPLISDSAALWPRYCVAGWNHILMEGVGPDLILIDGRFRIASFLATLHLAASGTTILFDDYFDRPEYHFVEKHIHPVEQAGRMARFVVPHKAIEPAWIIDLMNYCADPH